jgi:hypothetical protein
VWPPVHSICVTRGALLAGGKVDAPTFRGVAPGTSGDGIGIDFVFNGPAHGSRALASGSYRRQLGLKLRAVDGCNLVYVMWRLDPRPQLEVSVKANPGSRTHAQCGASGYTKVASAYDLAIPTLRAGDRHTLAAQINGDDLIAWIDGQVRWTGRLPIAARQLHGPAGLRSDNLAFALSAIWAPPSSSSTALPRCLHDGED